MPNRVINLSVRGHHPLPYGNQEWPWRRAVAEQAQAWCDEHARPDIDNHTVFSVHTVFFIQATGIPPSDLDNLAKPVLDTLFRVNNPQVNDLTLTGVLVDVDDRGVCYLELEKRSVDSRENEGADIKVSWDEP